MRILQHYILRSEKCKTYTKTYFKQFYALYSNLSRIGERAIQGGEGTFRLNKIVKKKRSIVIFIIKHIVN